MRHALSLSLTLGMLVTRLIGLGNRKGKNRTVDAVCAKPPADSSDPPVAGAVFIRLVLAVAHAYNLRMVLRRIEAPFFWTISLLPELAEPELDGCEAEPEELLPWQTL